MKASSKKSKGKGFQNDIRDLLLETFVNLQQGDILSNGMGQHGQDIIISPKGRQFIPYSFQCKRCQSLNIYKAIQQAKSNCKQSIPAVVFRKNRMQSWISLPFQHFLDLIKNTKSNKGN